MAQLRPVNSYDGTRLTTEGAPVTLQLSAALDDIIDATAHGFLAGDVVIFESLTGGSGLVVGQRYFVIAANLAADTFQVSLTAGGAAVDFTTDITAGTVRKPRRLTFWLVSGVDSGSRVRGGDTIIPGAAGRTAEDRVGDGRLVEIQGWVRGVGLTPAVDFRDAMETLETLFDPTRAVATLVVGLEDGVRTKSISCRPLPDRMVRYRPVPAATVNVLFEAVGVDWVTAP